VDWQIWTIQRVKVGEDLEMSDAEGNPLVGKVISIGDDGVEMDFNHPLAGYDLHFIGEVLEVRTPPRKTGSWAHSRTPRSHH